MQVEIITPEKSLFAGNADSLIVPAVDGELGILNDHAPMVAALKKGDIRLTHNGKTDTFVVTGGVLEVKKNKVIVLAE
jgi:F-type H+-transporting ATPase subunit epsilon